LGDRNPRREITVKITIAARQLRHVFDHFTEQCGLTRAQWGAIVVVNDKQGTTQREIASKLEVTEVTAGRMIDRLCAEGYLVRRAHPADKRAYCVYTTPAARPVLDKLGVIAGYQEDRVFVDFSEEEIEQMAALLEKLARNIARMREQTVQTEPQEVAPTA
jgi:DNA-binding MarR family transcriptional regulator